MKLNEKDKEDLRKEKDNDDEAARCRWHERAGPIAQAIALNFEYKEAPDGFSSMAAQNKPQRVIKMSADDYLEELKKMYFKTKYINRGPHSDTGGVSFHDTGGVAFHGRLRIAICGHVDTHGASTGRLIFELESLSECEKDRLEQAALQLRHSRAGFFQTFCRFYQNWLEKDYARARTNANTRKEFTDKSHYTIIEDGPAHHPAANR